jgi:circadian clock protein KaiC
VLNRIIAEVETYSFALVFIDSLRSVVLSSAAPTDPPNDLQQFMQRLGMIMTSWQAILRDTGSDRT